MPSPNKSSLEMPGYRLLRVKSVMRIRDSEVIEVEFEELLRIFNIRITFLLQQTGNRDLAPGDEVFIKGKNGNMDHQIWGEDEIEHIKIAKRGDL